MNSFYVKILKIFGKEEEEEQPTSPYACQSPNYSPSDNAGGEVVLEHDNKWHNVNCSIPCYEHPYYEPNPYYEWPYYECPYYENPYYAEPYYEEPYYEPPTSPEPEIPQLADLDD